MFGKNNNKALINSLIALSYFYLGNLKFFDKKFNNDAFPFYIYINDKSLISNYKQVNNLLVL